MTNAPTSEPSPGRRPRKPDAIVYTSYIIVAVYTTLTYGHTGLVAAGVALPATFLISFALVLHGEPHAFNGTGFLQAGIALLILYAITATPNATTDTFSLWHAAAPTVIVVAVFSLALLITTPLLAFGILPSDKSPSSCRTIINIARNTITD